MAQPDLFTRRDILNHGASSDLLDAFRVRPIEVSIETAGALGTATMLWRFVGDTEWAQVAEPSEAGSSWQWSIKDPAYAVVTFAAQSYSAGNTWTVATDGTVTAQGAAPATVTAVRVDVVAAAITGVTSDFVTWACSRCVQPIISIDEGQKGWCATIAAWRIKLRSGVTPADAGSGDAIYQREAERAEDKIRAIGVSSNRPPGVVDSSSGGTGSGIPLMPLSDALQGW